MERLTKRNEADTAYYYPNCFDKCDGFGFSSKCDNCGFQDKVCDKLGEYEDAEEQGLLVKILCHCKDCSHWVDGCAGCTEHVKLCDVGHYMVGGNGYCLYAEQKLKETEGE